MSAASIEPERVLIWLRGRTARSGPGHELNDLLESGSEYRVQAEAAANLQAAALGGKNDSNQ